MKVRDTSSLKDKFDSFEQCTLHLHTPAHQGVGPQDGSLSEDLLYLDSPYITRCDLKPLEAKIRAYYDTKHTFVLTGGASQGLLAALLVLGRKHRRVWVQRNCHKSVISGLILSGLEPVFFAPNEQVLGAQDLKTLFAASRSDAPTCIILTNPTYEGWGCDLESCITVCRAQGLTIVVDEAHGSLWPASPTLPKSALKADVDLVVHSLHKYCGAIVQSALVHLPHGSCLTVQEYHSALELVETTSKSNLVLLSIEEALDAIFERNLCDRLSSKLDRLNDIRARIADSDGVLKINVPLGVINDPLKLFIHSDFVASEQLMKYFAEVGVDYELYNSDGVLFLFSIYNTDSDLDLFENAVETVIKRVRKSTTEPIPEITAHLKYNQPQMQLSPRAAYLHLLGSKPLPLSQATGYIAAEMVASCPPGWPLVIPGEVLGDWHIQTLGTDFIVQVIKGTID
jgi:arginine decarboxylase